MQDSTALYKAAKDGGQDLFITTSKGNQFYFNRPAFDHEEIAHALGNLCRYGGHCRRFYSVAEHSLLVSMLCEQLALADPFEGLMHDGHEAYLCDMPSPSKAMLPDYRAMEGKLEKALRMQYRLLPTISDGCKFADWVALAIEARQLLPKYGNDFLWPDGVRAQAERLQDIQLNFWDPGIARSHFLAAFNEMGTPRGL